MKLYGIHDAAEFLGITVAALKYHIRRGNIHPQKIGKTLVFTQEQLDNFTRRPQGRPKSKE